MTSIDLERISCNVCGSDDSALVFELLDSTEIKHLFRIVRCCNCGLMYVNPRPTVSEISKFYPETLVSYQFEVADFNPRATTRDKIISAITKSLNVGRIHSISQCMRLDSGTRVLDVGCGKGAFLYYLRNMCGCQTQGIDFDEKCLLFCRENLHLDVLKGDLSRAEGELRVPCDLITMWSYLEHDFDPMSTLAQSRAYLADDGMLVIEVPNECSLENRIFGKKSFLYEVPVHLYNFSQETLKELLKRAGFRVQKITYPIGAGGWFGTLQRFLTKDRVYKDLRGHLPFLLLVGGLIYPLEFLLGFTKLGSMLRVFAKKI
jgi:2-polyprenyl-3-methyl-5-hydroxy-6-metoxy-1,4-benzoquinol methylase